MIRFDYGLGVLWLHKAAIATKTPLKVATIINRSYLEGLGNYE